MNKLRSNAFHKTARVRETIVEILKHLVNVVGHARNFLRIMASILKSARHLAARNGLHTVKRQN
jgi:hypothetical protein